MLAEQVEMRLSTRIAHVLSIHFDPVGGSPYWLERQRQLGIDVRRDIRHADDLALLGLMDEAALTSRPVEDFLPRSLRNRRAELVIGETAGTLGRPKYAMHRLDEFQAAFVEPFLAAARLVRFPRELNWLFIGPSGPHIIGKAARACANSMGSPDPFTIDLDPRWAKKLPPGTFGWKRYVEHIEDQALAILACQRIGVIFSTPVVLENLGPRMAAEARQAIRGIHLGGVSVSHPQRESFARHFPNAVILSGFGNTLFGVMPELRYSPQTGFDYYPHGERLLIRTVGLRERDAADRLAYNVPPGERGQVVMTRLDETQLIVNMMERDSAVLLPPPAHAIQDGFVLPGLRDPQPIVNERIKPALGLY